MSSVNLKHLRVVLFSIYEIPNLLKYYQAGIQFVKILMKKTMGQYR